MIKNTEDFYNETAVLWAEDGYSDDYPAPYLDFVQSFPKGSRFLDLCCGCGYDSMRIHKCGYEVIGIDFSKGSLCIARERNPDIAFYGENIINDYIYIGKIDGIINIAGLVHIETKDLPLVFSRMRQVLTENGRVWLTIREGKGKLWDRSLKTINGEEYDRNFIAHTLEELIKAAEGMFIFENEAAVDGSIWRNYIFKRT